MTSAVVVHSHSTAADLPILFSAPMVRAILREIGQPGTGKTQTRRVLTPHPPADMGLIGIYAPRLTAVFGYATPDADCKIPLRYMPGDRLYVREAHHRTNDSTDSHLVGYDFADGPVTREDRHIIDGVGDVQFFRHSLGGWGGRTSRNYPAMHMPRWASRITLIVTDVRVQRLQEISEADAIAEGVESDSDGWRDYQMPATQCCGNARDSFRTLWDSINATRGYGWEENPWVAAYTFRPILGNIDQVSASAHLPGKPVTNRAGVAAW